MLRSPHKTSVFSEVTVAGAYRISKENPCTLLLKASGILTVGVLEEEVGCSLFVLTGVSQSNVIRALLLVNDFFVSA